MGAGKVGRGGGRPRGDCLLDRAARAWWRKGAVRVVVRFGTCMTNPGKASAKESCAGGSKRRGWSRLGCWRWLWRQEKTLRVSEPEPEIPQSSKPDNKSRSTTPPRLFTEQAPATKQTNKKKTMSSEKDQEGKGDDQVVYPLSRGGAIVLTSIGPIQFGCPPETIKDSMVLGLGIPTHYVIPANRFVRKFGPSQGINAAEFEFPAYCNFFFKGKRVSLVVNDEDVKSRIENVFQETLLGPREIDPEEDFSPSFPRENRPDLSKELGFFRKFGDKLMTVEMLLDFKIFDQKSKSVKIESAEGDDFITLTQTATHYMVLDSKGSEIARVPLEVHIPTPKQEKVVKTIAFEPPLFGVTVLGSSHGFDPKGKTSGYVLWMNRRGIMVDPPPNSSSLLQANHIAPSLIDAVIVTHCHADHDAGTFQKILQEGKVTLMTTPTIFGSFIRKYSGLSGLDEDFLKSVLQFRPVQIGEKMKVRGGVLNFFYSLHSIPCVGFEAFFGGKSIVFSADHMNDPARISQLCEEGVLSEGRRDSLLAFPWHHDLVLHEAGVPPIHTPMETLSALPEDVKKRLLVVHVSLDKVPADLRAAIPGVENTVVFEDVEAPQHAKALETLDLLSSIPMFAGLTLRHASEVLSSSKVQTFKAGEAIIQKGEIGTSFYTIMSGQAKVQIVKTSSVGSDSGGSLSPRSARTQSTSSDPADAADGEQQEIIVKTYFAGDYFGEQALLTEDAVRTADIIAVGDVKCLRFDRSDFIELIKNTGIAENLQSLAHMRNLGSWDAMEANSLLRKLSASQKTQLEICFKHHVVEKGKVIWQAGSLADGAILVANGALKPTFQQSKDHDSGDCETPQDTEAEILFERGAFILDSDALLNGKAHEFDLCAEKDTTFFQMNKNDLLEIFQNNPGFLLALMKSRYML